MNQAINYYKKAFNNYIVFSGRATRSEYWYFFLVNVLLYIAVSILGGLISKDVQSLFQGLYSLALFLPGLAVAVRRLHDTDRSAWWVLINCIPLVGWIIFIVFLATDSTPGENKYGPNPKGSGAQTA